MITDHKLFQETPRNFYPARQAVKKPIKVVMSNGEYHITRRSTDKDNSGLRRKDSEINLNTTNSNTNNAKAYFGSPVPMIGGTFPCGSPCYPAPPTPPLEEGLEQEVDDGNDVEFDDDERNFISQEAAAKKLQSQHQQALIFFPCGSPRMDEYLSASSSDDDDDEVCQLMFRNSSVATTTNTTTAAIDNNNVNSSIIKLGPDTRSRTSQRFGQGHVTSSVRGHATQARDQTNAGVQHGRVHKKFRAIDVTSVGNQRPSLNFRKMRKSSFHRKHHRLTERLSSQIQTALSTSM